MKKRIVFLSLAIMLIFSGCQTEEYLTCPDNVTKVIDLANCPREQPTCPADCNDNDKCTFDSCSALSNYECKYEPVTPCDGNGVCEEGEFPWSVDCPKSCDDNNECSADTFDYTSHSCFNEPILPCCGNNECESGETFVNCQADCEQLLDITVVSYQKKTYIDKAAAGNLIGTDYIYLIVNFKIHNIGIDETETLNYHTSKGFYYDPFKMRLEDEKGKLYSVDYDSDLLSGWLDYTIFPKGNTKGAALLFIVPKNSAHLRLIAYDRYGSKMDISEIY